MRKSAFVLWTAVLLLILGLGSGARSQTTGSAVTNPSTDGMTSYAAVRVDGRKLFDVIGSSGLSAAERADKVNRRLNNLIARDDPVRPFDRQDLVTSRNTTTITLGGVPVLTVTDADAQDALSTRDELALLWGAKMATAIADARATRSIPLRALEFLSATPLPISSARAAMAAATGGSPRVVHRILDYGEARSLGCRVGGSRTRFDTNLRQLLRALAFYGTWIVGLLAILSTLGLDSTSIATTLGISGFVLGFAFKDILSHFFAGLMLLLGRQFHIGDQIVVKDNEGTVERIELRALYLRTYDNRLVIIPNGDVFTSTVTSNTASPHRRREFIVGIGYADNIKKAQEVALQTVRRVEGVAHDPAPDVLVDELAASTVNLNIRFFTNSQRADYLRVGSECMRQVKEAFDNAKISMPTDIQTIVISKRRTDRRGDRDRRYTSTERQSDCPRESHQGACVLIGGAPCRISSTMS